MTAPRRFRVEPLGEHHDRASFSCGTEALDRYLHRQAGQDARRMVAAVFVLLDAEADIVAGYYTLSASAVQTAALPDDVTRKLPRYPQLPSILLGRLALDCRYQGQRLGNALLIDALQRSRTVAELVGATFVVVEAKDDAARSFYERFGFRRFGDDSYRLFLPMRTIERGGGTLP